MRLLMAAGAPGKTEQCVYDYTLPRPRANPQGFTYPESPHTAGCHQEVIAANRTPRATQFG